MQRASACRTLLVAQETAVIDKVAVTFRQAASLYPGERKFLPPLITYFQEAPLKQIDQTAIDRAAAFLYPHGSPATWNRQVYTPASAVLKYAGEFRQIKRRRQQRAHWLFLSPAQSIQLEA